VLRCLNVFCLILERPSAFSDTFQVCNSWLSGNSCTIRLKLPDNYLFLIAILGVKVTHKTTFNDQVAFLTRSSVCTAMRKTVMIQHCVDATRLEDNRCIYQLWFRTVVPKPGVNYPLGVKCDFSRVMQNQNHIVLFYERSLQKKFSTWNVKNFWGLLDTIYTLIWVTAQKFGNHWFRTSDSTRRQ